MPEPSKSHIPHIDTLSPLYFQLGKTLIYMQGDSRNKLSN
jgi:hypothetical protein